MHGLNGVDSEYGGLHFCRLLQYRVEVGFSVERESLCGRSHTACAQACLCDRLFAARVEDSAVVGRETVQDLAEQGGLAHARVSSDQHQRSWNQS
jgi:hypothetical protein